jgi:hypothetical protein
MQTTKVIEDGRVYARTDYGNGTIVIEKADPQIVHDAPSSVAAGTLLNVTFQLVDFDGEARTDSGGTLLLDLGGTEVSLPIANGEAVLPIELHAPIDIRQQPPYFTDARLAPFVIQVVNQ